MESETPLEGAENGAVRLSMRWAVILLLLLAGAVAYVWVGFAYASSVSYETPGGTWLESLMNLGIRVLGWPVLLATHQ